MKQNPDDLERTLRRIDGRGYKAYKDIAGEYDYGEFTLWIDHVQGDPFAAPSRLHIRVSHAEAGFPADTYSTRSRRIGLDDLLLRHFDRECRGAERRRGTGKSGLVAIDHPGQEILERTAVIVDDDGIEVRFFVGLPARGRTILGREANLILNTFVPEIARKTLFFTSFEDRSAEVASLYTHIKTNEDADYLRDAVVKQGLVSFIPDGAILPRRSGIDDRPLREGNIIEFKSPESLSVNFVLPNCGEISGMGIPAGVTLIVGGGYHGKSTVLNAIERGIYNHIPGDGREFVVTDPGAVKIRAEDGRRVERVNISPFISNLPFDQDTTAFSTENASGSTSQAANIMEALEAGARVILTDEDTAATNFMIRDHRMQELIAKDKEPITPFVDKIRQLRSDLGVSTILVMGGSGDYFDVADQVVAMEGFLARDVTGEAGAIASKYSTEREREGGDVFGEFTPRVPRRESLDPSKGRREVKISGRGLKTILFGRHTIDLSSVEGLVHPSQVNAIGQAIYYARSKYMDSLELAAAINRLPTLKVL
jgi:predicted ABC-class ATPase